jgi:hypothetical protein
MGNDFSTITDGRALLRQAQEKKQRRDFRRELQHQEDQAELERQRQAQENNQRQDVEAELQRQEDQAELEPKRSSSARRMKQNLNASIVELCFG